MKIGVLGGTFNPPHMGHLALAKAALKSLELDEVLFLPANRSPLKKNLRMAPGKDRLAMVQLMIREEPQMAVCDLEVTKGGLSYTVETMTELVAAQPADYWFLLGADALKSFPEWKQPQRLIRLCRLGVVRRASLTEADVLLKVPEEYRAAIDQIEMAGLDVSSTDVRARLEEGKAANPLLPKIVLDYIRTNKLYQI